VADPRLGSVTDGETVGLDRIYRVTGAVTLLERSAARLLVKRLTKEDAMRRTHKALATLALGLALVGATSAAAAATAPTGTQDQADQRKALYPSELERNLATAADRTATRPSAPTDPAPPSPGVDVVATLLIGLVGGLVGGAAAMIGWTATTHRRRPRAAADT
jgi:hypothetical protein